MNVKVCLLVTMTTVMTSAQDETSAQQVIACGIQLAQLREDICFGIGMAKRNQIIPAVGKQSEAMSEASWPLAERESALRWYRGKRGGLADECCVKQCYLSEIQNYC